MKVSRSRWQEDGFGGWGRPGGMRVVMVLHSPIVNGASIAALRAVPDLVTNGHRFAFWVPAPGGMFDWLAERGAEVHGAPKLLESGLAGLREPPGVFARVRSAPAYLAAFRDMLTTTAPQIVHGNSLYSYLETLAAKGRNRRTVFHLHDMAPTSWKASPVRWMVRRAFDDVIAASSACAESYGGGRLSPSVVYESAPLPEQAVELREAPDPFVVGTIGVIARRKGVDIFTEAAERLSSERDPGIEFRMVGSPSDPLEREWGEKLIERAVSSGVIYIPEVESDDELRSWDAFVLASRTDPCPLVMLEAMAAGLPVVGVRRDGMREQITEDCGLLAEPEQPASLAEAIRTIVALPLSERSRMGVAGRARVASEFSPARQAEGIAAAYARALR